MFAAWCCHHLVYLWWWCVQLSVMHIIFHKAKYFSCGFLWSEHLLPDFLFRQSTTNLTCLVVNYGFNNAFILALLFMPDLENRQITVVLSNDFLTWAANLFSCSSFTLGCYSGYCSSCQVCYYDHDFAGLQNSALWVAQNLGYYLIPNSALMFYSPYLI